MKMEKEPLYMSTPTFRNYDDYHDAYNYYKGWNDAMHFIFDTEEEKRKKLIKGDKNEKDTNVVY